MAVAAKIGADGSPARALWYEAPGRVALRTEPLPPAQAGTVCVRTLFSAISRGTERLVAAGRVPASEMQRMRAPFQGGDFPFPVKYGYCAAGVVEDGPDELMGRTVFVLHPHQSLFRVPAAAAVVVPDAVGARRATLAANMETALNALWDSGAGPGDRIAVVGGGVVGLLVAWLSARLPGAEVTVVDTDPSRADIAARFGARFATPQMLARGGDPDADVVFHASASAAGLSCALSLAGLEARVMELSWYGAGETAVPLGGAFHSKRLDLRASQVGHVAPSRRARWSHARRLAKALELLADARLDALVTHEFPFDELPDRLPDFLAPGAPGLAALVRY